MTNVLPSVALNTWHNNTRNPYPKRIVVIVHFLFHSGNPLPYIESMVDVTLLETNWCFLQMLSNFSEKGVMNY